MWGPLPESILGCPPSLALGKLDMISQYSEKAFARQHFHAVVHVLEGTPALTWPRPAPTVPPLPQIGWFDLDANASGVLTSRLASDATFVRGAVGDTIGLVLQVR